MRQPLASSIVVLSLLMVTTFAVLVGTSLTTRAQRADSPRKLCSLNISASVRELSETGEEFVLDFEAHPELNPNAWGIYDKRRSGSSPITFNQGSLAQYQVFTTDRAFAAFPEDQEIYDEGDSAFATLAFESQNYEIVRKEIRTCQKGTDVTWLCTETRNVSENASPVGIETINGLRMDCGMKLEFGWVVRPIQNFAEAPQSTTLKAVNKAADINLDEAYNTLDLLAVINVYGQKGASLKADVNNDGAVNALDYTLVVEAIETQ